MGTGAGAGDGSRSSSGSDAYDSIAELVDQKLAHISRENELRITYMRVTCGLLIVLVNLWLHVSPPASTPTFPLKNAFIMGGWVLAWLVLLLALRAGHYRSWMAIVLPICDAIAVYTVALVFWASKLSVEFDYAGEVAVLLAAAGGLRFRRDSIVIATLSGLAAFLAVQIMANREPARIPFVATMVVGAGFLAYWLNVMVRDWVGAEIAKGTLSRFLPASVVESAQANPLSLVTEPRALTATILISDLRAFTSMSETMSPTEALRFLNDIQGMFAAAVWQSGGTVDKFMGDGMLAVFGAVDPPGDHASNALHASVAMLNGLSAINERYRAAGVGPINVGVGIHSGPVVTGCLGSGTRLEFTVIGDTVNTASRLEQLTKQHDCPILVSEATLAAARASGGIPERFAMEPRGLVDVRGRQDRVDVVAVQVA